MVTLEVTSPISPLRPHSRQKKAGRVMWRQAVMWGSDIIKITKKLTLQSSPVVQRVASVLDVRHMFGSHRVTVCGESGDLTRTQPTSHFNSHLKPSGGRQMVSLFYICISCDHMFDTTTTKFVWTRFASRLLA